MSYSNYYLSKNNKPNNNFVIWINAVEQLVLTIYGLKLLDIPDEDYMNYYENKYQPNEMFQIIQESNGFVQVQKKKKITTKKNENT